MFRFIHTYSDEGWEGLFRQNLFREGDGLKVMHTNYMSPEFRFNTRFAEGTKLRERLREVRGPFYLDRYQGGIAFPYLYDYDPKLLARLAEQFGDDFWGFQMHEWASNYRSETSRIKLAIRCFEKENPGTPLSVFWEEKKKAVLEDVMALFTEANPPSEWEEMKLPETYADFSLGARALWSKRMQMLGQPLFAADSYYMSHRITLAGGARRVMPEIGWQIPDQRIQLAYARGMARAAGVPFGVYYECWCCQDGKNLTIPYAADTYLNEWDEQELRDQSVRITGDRTEKGGSSRSLQERSWRYSYLSGADAIGEEYGVCNTFRNYTDFELSEYGQVKKDFLRFTEKYPEPGEPYAPFAVVLPAEMEYLTLNDEPDGYCGYKLSSFEPFLADKIRVAKKLVSLLLTDEGAEAEPLGSESHVLKNGLYPDVFDILHGDMKEALASYPYLIDGTGDPTFARRNADRIVPLEKIKDLLPKVLPVTVSGAVHSAFTRTGNGWLLYLCNENGVLRRDYEGDRFLPEAELSAQIRPGFLEKPSLKLLDGTGKLSEENGTWSVTLGAGEWLLLGLS